MKKILFGVFAGLALVSIMAINGCKKDDTTPPTITLNGSNPYSMTMRTSYTEPGFTASDDEDGDITSRVSTSNDISANVPGHYHVDYSVSDAAGNSTSEEREVNVVATPAALAATYNVVDTCGTSTVYTYTQTITAVNSSTIGFNKFADYSGNTGITAIVNSDGTLSIPLQSALNIGSLLEDHDFQGTGVVTESGIKFTYTDKNNSAVPVSTASCRAYYTRQ